MVRRREPRDLDEQEMEALFARYHPLIERKCKRILGDTPEAEDLAQETFARLWRGRATLRDPAAAVRWLYVVATHGAYDRLKSKGHRVAEPVEVVDVTAGPDRVVTARLRLDELARRLEPHEWELVILWRVDGLKQAELASVLEVSERTIRRRLSSLRGALAAIGGSDV